MVTPFLVLLIMLLLSLVVIGPILHGVENNLLSAMEVALHLPFGIGGLIIGFFWSIITLTGVQPRPGLSESNGAVAGHGYPVRRH